MDHFINESCDFAAMPTPPWRLPENQMVFPPAELQRPGLAEASPKAPQQDLHAGNATGLAQAWPKAPQHAQPRDCGKGKGGGTWPHGEEARRDEHGSEVDWRTTDWSNDGGMSWGASSWHSWTWNEGSSSWQADTPYGKIRTGVNGGRIRVGDSGGSAPEYYKNYYTAKGRGRIALNAFLNEFGPPPSRGGKAFHCRQRS